MNENTMSRPETKMNQPVEMEVSLSTIAMETIDLLNNSLSVIQSIQSTLFSSNEPYLESRPRDSSPVDYEEALRIIREKTQDVLYIAKRISHRL